MWKSRPDCSSPDKILAHKLWNLLDPHFLGNSPEHYYQE